jgi:hypothetical protein
VTARLATLLALLVLLVPASALAQETPFGPLPPGPPEATPQPTATPSLTGDEGVSRELLLGIGAGLLLVFLVIGFVIVRDARDTLPEDRRAAEQQPRDAGPHRHERQAKAKARKKGREQRAARKTARRRAK